MLKQQQPRQSQQSRQNDGHTQYNPTAYKPQTEAKPTLVHNGMKYPLNVGRNTVGRRAQTSTSLIQIATDDRYMSRVNAIFEVSRTQTGWQVCVSSCNGTNLVKINGYPVPMGDRIILMDGMTITLGHTDLHYAIM